MSCKLLDSYLKLIIGPMFSGKSSSLISEINFYTNENILVINSILDKSRHNDMNIVDKIGYIKTHNQKVFPALMLNKLNELKSDILLYKKYKESSIIIIDEGQFFSDLYEFIKCELNTLGQNKVFIVASLSSNYLMEPIGDIIKLIPIADCIQKLSSTCAYCKSPASFTKLIKRENDTNDTNNTIIVGGSDKYVPTCRRHFN